MTNQPLKYEDVCVPWTDMFPEMAEAVQLAYTKTFMDTASKLDKSKPLDSDKVHEIAYARQIDVVTAIRDWGIGELHQGRVEGEDTSQESIERLLRLVHQLDVIVHWRDWREAEIDAAYKAQEAK